MCSATDGEVSIDVKRAAGGFCEVERTRPNTTYLKRCHFVEVLPVPTL